MVEKQSTAAAPDQYLQGLSSSEIARELNVAWRVFPDDRECIAAVARSIAQLPFTQRAIADYRRDRDQAAKKRESYRSLNGPKELLRWLVLDELERLERRGEDRLEAVVAPSNRLNRYVKAVVKVVLELNSFYAAVAMCQVICDLNSHDLLTIYDAISPSRGTRKDSAAITRARQRLTTDLMDRFGPSLQVDTNPLRLRRDAATATEATIMTRALECFMPDPPDSSTPAEDAEELNAMRTLLLPSLFIAYANDISVNGDEPLDSPPDSFEESAFVPVFVSSPGGLPPGSDDPAQDVDWTDKLGSLHDAVATCVRRRRRVAPGSLRLYVDGIDRGPLADDPSWSAVLEEGASVLRLVGFDGEDDEEIPVATCLLSDDIGHSTWRIVLPDDRELSWHFYRYMDGTVRMWLEDKHPMTPSLMSPALAWDRLPSLFFDAFDGPVIVDGGRLVQVLKAALRECRVLVVVFGARSTHPRDSRATYDVIGTIVGRSLSTASARYSLSPVMARWRAWALTSAIDRLDFGRTGYGLLDKYVSAQTEVAIRFLNRAREEGIDPDPVPHVDTKSDRLSVLLSAAGFFAGLALTVPHVVGPVLPDVIDRSISGFLRSGSTIWMLVALLCLAGWWTCGWTRRLTNRYRQLEREIADTQLVLFGGGFLYEVHSADRGDSNSIRHRYTPALNWNWIVAARLVASMRDHDVLRRGTRRDIARVIHECGQRRSIARRLARAIVAARDAPRQLEALGATKRDSG